MNPLIGLHGTAALILLCGLLFTEETGIPLPLLPSEGPRVAAGLLIANGDLSPLALFPAAVGGAHLLVTWHGTAPASAADQSVGPDCKHSDPETSALTAAKFGVVLPIRRRYNDANVDRGELLPRRAESGGVNEPSFRIGRRRYLGHGS